MLHSIRLVAILQFLVMAGSSIVSGTLLDVIWIVPIAMLVGAIRSVTLIWIWKSNPEAMANDGWRW
jgi:hypothetical protein